MFILKLYVKSSHIVVALNPWADIVVHVTFWLFLQTLSVKNT